MIIWYVKYLMTHAVKSKRKHNELFAIKFSIYVIRYGFEQFYAAKIKLIYNWLSASACIM